MAVVMACPAISRGTGLPGSVRPFTVTVASRQPTNRLGMWCLPVADLSGGRAKQNGWPRPAPGQAHGQVAGGHRLAVAARRIARGGDAVERPVDQAVEPRLALERAEMRDEAFHQVARQRLVVVPAEVAARRRRPGLLGRLQQHQSVATTVRRQHDAEKLASATNGPSGVSFSEMPGFSPDQSTVPGKTIGSAMASSRFGVGGHPSSTRAQGTRCATMRGARRRSALALRSAGGRFAHTAVIGRDWRSAPGQEETGDAARRQEGVGHGCGQLWHRARDRARVRPRRRRRRAPLPQPAGRGGGRGGHRGAGPSVVLPAGRPERSRGVPRAGARRRQRVLAGSTSSSPRPPRSIASRSSRSPTTSGTT